MKYTHARIGLVLAAALLGGCATRPPAPERPYLVQLSVTYSDGPCDWSLMQDVSDRPMMSGVLGSAKWPHRIPAPSRARSAPLLAYGASAGSLTLHARETLCLPLYRRASVWQEGIPPTLGLQLTVENDGIRVIGHGFDPSLSQAVLMIRPYRAVNNFPDQRLNLIFRDGRAEGRLSSFAVGQSARVTVVATEVGGEGQSERALELLTPIETSGSLIVREGSRLVARPSWPPPDRRSSRRR